MRLPVPALRIARVLATLSVLLSIGSTAATADQPVVRIGLTPVFLDNRSDFLDNWRKYLERQLRRRVKFIQRRTYREITELVLTDELDAAWICGFPFVRHQARLRLLAVPLYQGEPLYQSYLIVPASDQETSDILDLEGKVFAYSDPDSNSGFLVPTVRLVKAGIQPDRFFARTFFSWAHRDVVVAVADGVANAGAVDGYVWETLRLHRPDLVNRTRVAAKSQKFGFPPFVASTSIPDADFEALQAVLLDMSSNREGRALLNELSLDGFVPGEPALFDDIRRAAQFYLQEG